MKNKSFPGISNFFFLFLLGWSLVPASAQPSCAAPPTGLVDWWPGEGNGVDVVTGGAGTPYPGTGFTNGVVGQAFSFDGITGCVMNTNTPGLTNIQNSFTFEFWAYPQKSFVLVGEGATNANGNFGQSYAIFPEWAGDDGAGAGVCVGSNGISVLCHGGNYLPALLTYTNSIKGWVHVAVVFTNKQPTLYLNGIKVRTGLASSRAYVFPSKNLGNCYDPNAAFQTYGPYQGLLDEVSIYNRPLGATEILAIYAAGSAGKCFTGIPPTITNAPVAQSNLLGGTVSFSVAASGPPPLTYQWSFAGTNLLDATNATLTLTNVPRADAGIYTVVVANPYGAATNATAALTVLQPPYIISQPAGQSVPQFSPVSFTVVGGGPDLTYQWQFNGATLRRATNATYSLAGAGLGNAGNYRVVLSNTYGTITSSNALLSVIYPALATAFVQDGFVTSNNVTAGGFGYTNIPNVRIEGGGGTGAMAVAVLSNGVVTGIVILNAGFGYTNTPQVFIEPPIIPEPVMAAAPMTLLSYAGLAPGGGTNGSIYQLQMAQGWYWTNIPPTVATSNSIYVQFALGTANSNSYRLALEPLNTQAFASAVLSYGFVVAADITDGGYGYVTNPVVEIVGGGGSNATALSFISTNGDVTNIVITSAGSGYTSEPAIEIAPPPATAIIPLAYPGFELSATNLLPFETYQLEVSSNVTSGWMDWTNGLFLPTNAASSVEFIFNTNAGDFFKMQYVH